MDREAEMKRLFLFFFFLSGAAGLIYEVVWSRLLGLIFGTSALAISTVLFAFMGGMALGSIVLGRWVDRWRSPLLLYGILEGLIGIVCLFVPLLLSYVSGVYKIFYPSLQGSFLSISLVRFALILLVLLPPTFLMGGTFPAFTSGYAQMKEVGKDLGVAYAVNTGGAVVGTLLAGFVLLPSIGMSLTIKIAVTLNLLVFGGCLVFARKQEQMGERGEEDIPYVYPHSLANLSILVIGISGFSSMALEVAWTRALHMVFGITTYAFTSMLSAFLLGLAIGSAEISRIMEKRKDLPLLLAIVEGGIGFSALLVSRFIDDLPHLFLYIFKLSGGNFYFLQVIQFLVCFLVLLIPTFLFGASFPLALRISLKGKAEMGRSIGGVYASNTLGNIIGSFSAGFLLMPIIGASGIIVLASFLNLIAGGVMLWGIHREKLLPQPRLAGALFLCAVLFSAFPLRWDIKSLTSGVYLYAPSYLEEGSIEKAKRRIEQRDIVYYKDSLTSTVTVTRGVQEGFVAYALQIDGKTEASSHWDLSTQYMISHLPLLLSDSPRKAMLIGLASGCSLGAALAHPLQEIYCLEIEPAMKEACEFFREVNDDCLSDSRARIIIDDGRNFLALTNEKYDCIISEPSNPWISGLGNLFSREFYEICKARLNKGGILALWIPAYVTSVEDFKGMIATVTSVFPYVTLWNYPPLWSDVIVICSSEPLKISPLKIQRKIEANPRLQKSLGRIGIKNAWDVLKGFLLPPNKVQEFCRGMPINTDDLPRVEYSSPRWLYAGLNYRVLDELLALCDNVPLPTDSTLRKDLLALYPRMELAQYTNSSPRLLIKRSWEGTRLYLESLPEGKKILLNSTKYGK